MDTPVCDFVSSYSDSKPLRMHMPGHKGRSILGIERLDITEIPGADVLYHSDGIIEQSEKNASALFGTAKTLYSTEGSSLSIRAMLYLTALYARAIGRRPVIAAGRNAHKVFITAAALMDIDVRWIFPESGSGIVSCHIGPERLEEYLAFSDVLPAAVYITSPDYLGNIADITALSKVCRNHGVLLLVDNAHGAYLRFLPVSRHPVDCGADMCCDSAHKTLPVLTGGAYLHISHSAPALLCENAEQAMSLFASTSPSYIILQSLDRANAYLSDAFPELLEKAAADWDNVRTGLIKAGFELCGSEPLKLTVLPKSWGYTGTELGALLEKHGIYCEFYDPDALVMMLPVEYEPEVPGRILSTLLGIPRREMIQETAPMLSYAERVFSPHELLLCESELIPVSESEGRIMAAPAVSCPPAIPPVSLGERISHEAIELMLYYGLEFIRVMK